jgi:hypothetical protein
MYLCQLGRFIIWLKKDPSNVFSVKNYQYYCLTIIACFPNPFSVDLSFKLERQTDLFSFFFKHTHTHTHTHSASLLTNIWHTQPHTHPHTLTHTSKLTAQTFLSVFFKNHHQHHFEVNLYKIECIINIINNS